MQNCACLKLIYIIWKYRQDKNKFSVTEVTPECQDVDLVVWDECRTAAFEIMESWD